MITLSQTKKIQSSVDTEAVLDWFATDSGQLLLNTEKQGFERLTRQLFGFHLLQLGLLDRAAPMMADTQVRLQTLVDDGVPHNADSCLAGQHHSLPVMTDSIDAVLLPHTLDFSQDPQKVLIEVERILVPEGRLILSGFNPFSLWGIVKTLTLKRPSTPMQGHFVSYTRLHDWLSLLGFDVEMTEVMVFRPPLSGQRIMEKLEFMEKLGSRVWPRFGAVYMIRAVKRVSKLTPVEPVWKRRPRLLSNVVKPTAGGVNRG